MPSSPSQSVPSLRIELDVSKSSGTLAIAGLDEAGRGALAGPVVAAAVLLPCDDPMILSTLAEVNDSKQVSAPVREILFTVIQQAAVAFGVGVVSAGFIDRYGIIAATKQAMTDAVAQLLPPAEYLLIDGRIRLAKVPVPQQSIIRGDSISLSIAAASILAKVTRDRLMIALDQTNPEYGFARHKGYGTAFHREALARLGPTPEHRRSFAPLRTTLV